MVKEINKNILLQLGVLKDQVEQIEEALEEITYSCLPSAINYDGMPHNKGGYIANDGLINMMAKKEKLESRLKASKKLYDELLSNVEFAISALEKENERKLVRLFYLDGYSWDEVLPLYPSKSRRTLERYLASGLTNLQFTDEVYKKWGR